MAEEVKKGPGNLIIMSIASDRVPTWEFLMTMKAVQPPINTSFGTQLVRGKQVDMARNELVAEAKRSGAKYMFFLDDDVLAPPDALIKLYHQLVYSKGKIKVASGVYYTKQQPPVPVILDKNKPGGVVEWVQGEVVEVDYAGCGCMLIDMSIFDEIEEPYFFFNRGRVDIDKDADNLGEDVWFCERVLKAGYKIVVDTGVQCGHQDHNGIIYRHDMRFGMGVWGNPGAGTIQYRPTLDQAKAARAEVKYQGGKVAWGYEKIPEGYSDAGKDCGDVVGIKSKLAEVTDVKITNLLQYRTNVQSQGILQALYQVMVQDAPVEIIVPDAVARRSVLGDESDIPEIEAACGTPAGAYQGLYTVRFMSEAMKQAGFKDILVVKENGDLIVKGRK